MEHGFIKHTMNVKHIQQICQRIGAMSMRVDVFNVFANIIIFALQISGRFTQNARTEN